MADPQTVQSQGFVLWFMALLLFTVVPYWCLAPAVNALRGPVGTDPSNPAIKESARPVVWFWLCGTTSLAFANYRTLQTGHRVIRVASRFMWAFGCVLCLLHIAVAFHLGHGWSHEAAWKHTRQASGFGDGISVNYAVAVVWLADAIWLCVSLESYFARPRWLHWAIHGFLAFIVINAAVVFGSWTARKSFALMALYWLLFILVGAVATRRSAEPPSAE